MPAPPLKCTPSHATQALQDPCSRVPVLLSVHELRPMTAHAVQDTALQHVSSAQQVLVFTVEGQVSRKGGTEAALHVEL